MLPPELMGAPPPDPSMGGMPPEMGAPPPGMPPEMMGGPLPPPDMMGGPPPPEGGPPAAPEAGRASDILKTILALAQQYADQENSQQNILLIEQLRTLCQKILAEEEKEAHDLMQGKVSPKAMLTYG